MNVRVSRQIEPKTHNMYSLHSSLVEHQLPVRGGGVCSSPGKYNIFKLGLPPSQDENAGGLELAGHLENKIPLNLNAQLNLMSRTIRY